MGRVHTIILLALLGIAALAASGCGSDSQTCNYTSGACSTYPQGGDPAEDGKKVGEKIAEFQAWLNQYHFDHPAVPKGYR